MYHLQGTIYESVDENSAFIKNTKWIKGIRSATLEYVPGGPGCLTVCCTSNCKFRKLVVPELTESKSTIKLYNSLNYDSDQIVNLFLDLIKMDIKRTLVHRSPFRLELATKLLDESAKFDGCILNPNDLIVKFSTSIESKQVYLPIFMFKMYFIKIGDKIFGGYRLTFRRELDPAEKVFAVDPKKTEKDNEFRNSLGVRSFPVWLDEFKNSAIAGRLIAHDRFINMLSLGDKIKEELTKYYRGG